MDLKRGYHPIVYPIHPCKKAITLVKKPDASPFTDVQRITFGSAMYIKGLFSKPMQHYNVD